VFFYETDASFVYIHAYWGRGVVNLVYCAVQGCTNEDSMLRRMNVSNKTALSILFLCVLMTTLLMGCRSSRLPTATPDRKAIQTQVIPQETRTASYYQTKAAQFLAQATADASGGGSSSDEFPYAPCVISILIVAAMVGIYARSRRKK
jgi:hypothetical protein